jgi:hypothetical protein
VATTAMASGDRRTNAAAAAVVAVILALALGGTVLAVMTAVGGRGSAAGNGIGDEVKTSFGTVTVESLQVVPGVSHRALSGATHGVSGLVDDNHISIQAAVAVTNTVNHPISYRARQFQLLVSRRGRTSVRSATGGDLPNMRILPRAGIEGHLDFTVPRSNAQLALRFHEPGRSDVVIDLGRAHLPAAGSGAVHKHSQH